MCSKETIFYKSGSDQVIHDGIRGSETSLSRVAQFLAGELNEYSRRRHHCT
jgi:hypothetical protein